MQLPLDNTHGTRLLGLDLLRAVAILIVLFAHAPVPRAGEISPVFASLFSTLKAGGWVGVDLFFVLSGFLVSGLLMREHQKHGHVRVGRFLIRRGWKIYPPLIVFIICMVPLQRYTLGFWPINRLISQALFIQNYTPGIQAHLWSLAVEEHAYLLIASAFGITAMLARRRRATMRLSWMPGAIAVSLVLILGLRLYNARTGVYSNYTHHFPTHLRIDSILAGVLFAYYYHYHRIATTMLLAKARPLLLVSGIALILPPFVLNEAAMGFIYTWGFTTNYIAGLCLLAWMIGCKPTRNRFSLGLAAIGKHSYSIYLWHFCAYHLMLYAITGQVVANPTWDGPFLLQLTLFFAVSIAMGSALSILIEVPTLRLRDRLSPSRSGQLESARVEGLSADSSPTDKPIFAAHGS